MRDASFCGQVKTNKEEIWQRRAAERAGERLRDAGVECPPLRSGLYIPTSLNFGDHIEGHRRLLPGVMGFEVDPGAACEWLERLLTVSAHTGLQPVLHEHEPGALVSGWYVNGRNAAARRLRRGAMRDREGWILRGSLWSAADDISDEQIIAARPASHTDYVRSCCSDGRTVWMLLVPTPSPWEAPAYIPLTGGNIFAAPWHIAAARRWWREYGARIVAARSDVYISRVDRPPADPAAALALAKQHVRYCSDRLVEDTRGSRLEVLAGELLGASTWWFWWD